MGIPSSITRFEGKNKEGICVELMPVADCTTVTQEMTSIFQLDPTGNSQLIDRGGEAYLLALFFSKKYPHLLKQPISSQDLASYVTHFQLNTKALEVEWEVSKLFEQFSRNRQAKTITFNGRSYQIGQDNINPVINGALRQADSSKRVFVAGTLSGVTGLYGTVSHEETITLGLETVSLVTMPEPEINVGITPTMLAVTDNISTVVVVESHLRENLTESLASPRLSTHYRRDVHEKIYEEFRKGGGVTQEAIGLMGSLVLAHEKGHFLITGQHGPEYLYLRQSLDQIPAPELLILSELYADLDAVEYILNLSKTDPQKALKAYRIWAIVRGPQTTDPMTKAEEGISNLLLSAATLQEGLVTVDWDLLASYHRSLKGILDKIFADMTHNIRFDIVGGTGEDARLMTPEQVKQEYDIFKQEIVRGLRGNNPSADHRMLEREAAARLVQVATRRTDPIYHELMLASYAIEVIAYTNQIDDWMRNQLRVSKVPFNYPPVDVIQAP